MIPEAENAVRSVARKFRADFLIATKVKPRSEHDRIITTLLDKHAQTIQCLPPDTFTAKRWLSYYVRQIEKEKSATK